MYVLPELLLQIWHKISRPQNSCCFFVRNVKWNKEKSRSTVSHEAEVMLFCMAAKWMLTNASISGGAMFPWISQLQWTVKITSTSWQHLWGWRTGHKWTFKYLSLSTVTGQRGKNDLKALVLKQMNTVSGFICLNVDVMQVFLILYPQDRNHFYLYSSVCFPFFSSRWWAQPMGSWIQMTPLQVTRMHQSQLTPR